MFGIGPTELAFFLVIVLLAVGPEKLPTFMRTVGKGLRQVRNASREFKEAIGLDELMREGDPFRSPPIRPPRARPVPVDKQPPVAAGDESEPESTAPASSSSTESTVPANVPAPPSPTSPPPVPPTSEAARALRSASESPATPDSAATREPDAPTGTDRP
ncbi:MAG: twin-arginine translocase TatA/TatE family subunit [Myxococcota bacterium]